MPESGQHNNEDDMKRIRGRVREGQMADIVREILVTRPKFKATFAQLRELVPQRVTLSRGDKAPSQTRPGEQKWQQIIRNIIAHKRAGFASVPDGIRLTGVRVKQERVVEAVAA
jgi:hypothetical protein